MDVLLPHQELTPYIRAYLHREIDLSGGDIDPFHFCLPTHKKFIMLYIGSSIKVTFAEGKTEDKKGMVVVGPLSKPVKVDFGQKHRFVAIELQNTGQYYLLDGCPIHTIMDCNIDADIIFGNKVNELTEKLTETHCPQQIKNELDLFFINHLKKVNKFHESTDLLLNNLPEGKNISELDSMANISNRQLERRFKDKIGMSPRFYAKLRRFANAYNLKENNANMSWTEIAHTSGYFDQMHLIRDFRFFSGQNPRFISEILKTQVQGYTEYNIPN